MYTTAIQNRQSRWYLLMLLLALVAILPGAPARGEEQQLQAWISPDPDTPPPDAIQLIEDPGFETGFGWSTIGDSAIGNTDAYLGEYSLQQGGVDAWGLAWTTFDLAPCEPGPVWVFRAYATYTAQPLLDPGSDISEGWLANEQHVSVVTLWQDFDYDWTNCWEFPWIVQVDGLFEALAPSTIGHLYIGASTNETRTDFGNDEVMLLCKKKAEVPEYRILLPQLFVGGE